MIISHLDVSFLSHNTTDDGGDVFVQYFFLISREHARNPSVDEADVD